MPQLSLSDGDLVKKTLRTTLVMLGSTAVWLAGLTTVVVMTTGPSSAAATPDSKDKAGTVSSAGAFKPAVPPGSKSHRGVGTPTKGSGDPI